MHYLETKKKEYDEKREPKQRMSNFNFTHSFNDDIFNMKDPFDDDFFHQAHNMHKDFFWNSSFSSSFPSFSTSFDDKNWFNSTSNHDSNNRKTQTTTRFVNGKTIITKT